MIFSVHYFVAGYFIVSTRLLSLVWPLCKIKPDVVFNTGKIALKSRLYCFSPFANIETMIMLVNVDYITDNIDVISVTTGLIL